MSRALLKCLVVALLWGAFEAIIFLGMFNKLLLSDIVLLFGFSGISPTLGYIIDLTIKLFPFLLFLILFGTYIYQHFSTASIYYFTRQPNRTKWFMKEAVKLYVLSFLYPFIMVVSGTAIASITNEVIFDSTSLILLIYYVLIHSFWLFLTALLMNIISIRLDSSSGFMIVVGLQMTFVTLLLLWDKMLPLEEDTPNLAFHGFLLQFNPISHIILSWHSSAILEVNKRINQFNITFSLNTSVVVLLLISMIVIFYGIYVVREQEWISQDLER